MSTKVKKRVKKNKIEYTIERKGDYFFKESSSDYKPRFKEYYYDKEHQIKLIQGDCIEVLNNAPDECVDMIFADPPYFLSNNGITCQAGKMVPVNKGKWDVSKGAEANHEFNLQWLKACQRVLKPNGTIWASGTMHVIYSIGFAMQQLGYKLLNDIVWYKRNAPPNLSCRYFTHSTEIVLWAAKSQKSKHHFDYKLMKQTNNGKQMRNVWPIDDTPDKVWVIGAPGTEEKKFGKHPTQKPVELLTRLMLASTKEGDLVLDPFCGSSTTGVAAILLNRKYVGIDLEDDYLQLSVKRLNEVLSPKKSISFTEKRTLEKNPNSI
ncbi:MAG: DNA methylase N-4/N-6 [candidate division Zixibacteria bacterium RBG-1]|nr:MAG: DNA methylase N-4/N-6 [candidate division Zixibacteria bacterium RBG-1]